MRLSVDHVRHSLRALSRNKRFSALAILSLAVAIALNTTMYSVLDAMVYPKLSIREPERLYNFAFYGDYHRRVPDAEKMEAVRALNFYEGIARRIPQFNNNIVERGSRIRDARIFSVSPNYFAVLGNQPSAGRLLSEADVNVEPRPVVMSERLWTQLFPDRASFDTAAILVNGEPRTVVGLLPYEADFPGAYTDVWQLPAYSTLPYPPMIFNIIRLRDGVSLQEAEAALGPLARRIAIEADGPRGDARFTLKPAVGEPFRFERFHLALIGAVVAVLLVACVNLANLQLARGLARSRELATRAAIGASRGDIIAQLTLEAAWLALGGLALGVLLTLWGMQLVTASIPPSLGEFLLRPQTSWRVFAFGAVASLASLGLIGFFPAIRLSRVDINELLKSGAGTGTSKRSRRQYGALVVVQISLALALLVGATLLLRTAANLHRFRINPYFDRLIQSWIRISPRDDADHRRLTYISTDLVSRARSIPGVVDAATITWNRYAAGKLSLADAGGTTVEVGVGMMPYGLVSSSYLRTVGISITKGRDFQEGEFAEPLVVVDTRTASYLWPGANPIGQLIKLGADSADARWLRVIGVGRHINWSNVDRSNQEAREAPRMGAVYVLNGADTTRLTGKSVGLQLTTRGSVNLDRLPVLLRQKLTDPAVGYRVTYAERMSKTMRIDMMRERQDFVTAIFMTFGLLALAVAALGVYAIVSHTVSQRTREFGVRMALGAGDTEIRRTVFQEGNVLALTGIAIGLILAARTVGMLQAFLQSEYDVYDSWLYAIVALVLFGITLVATYVPARRAMRINPVEALRNE